MSYSLVEDVRLEAGDPHPEDVTDGDIQKAIDAADTIIKNSTGETYVEGTGSWSLASEISRLYSAAFIMWKFDDPKDEAQKNFDLAEVLLQKLISEDEGAGDVEITSPEYKTFPLNPNAPIPRGRIAPLSHIEVAVDPDDIYEQEF